jgi:SAM-dependent methyltransferase
VTGPGTAPTDPFAELKARQAAAWGAAPFERVTETFATIHDRLIAALDPRPGETWLDLATGTGPIALRAARAGAAVTGLDLAPPLLETARRLAAAESLSIRFEAGDCERLPYPDAAFDTVVSSFGVMFAPDHAAVAGELARVCRPGGRLGLAAWRPDSGPARMTGVTLSFVETPPPAGAGNPFDWGRRTYAAARLGGAFELAFVEGNAPHVAPSAETIWELYVTSAGPVRRLAEGLSPDRRQALRQAYLDLLEPYRADGAVRFPREYVLVLGRRR